jgi:hypothetical protein
MQKKDINTIDYFKHYQDKEKEKRKDPEYKKRSLSSVYIYRKIVGEINEFIANHILETGLPFKLPCGMGYVEVTRQKQRIRLKDGKIDTRKLPPDWGETWKMWEELAGTKVRKDILRILPKEKRKIIYQFNEHTDGWIFLWHWNKLNVKIANQTVYVFRPTRKNKAKLAKLINNPNRRVDFPVKFTMSYDKS